ncbi:MAG: VOC family protein, partial [Cytophaga sp.]|uniref:VOC family protein n=1 Tax=Cytophaga sp. TaxID=29535 RepID=UPI003F7F4AF4
MAKEKILGLRTTIYKVSDIEKATSWYTSVFQTEPYFNEPFYVGFNIAGYELGLQPEEQPLTDKTDNIITYWGVKNIEAAYKDFIKAGATENEKPYNVGGEIVTATVKDPWGNIIGLIYNPEFKLSE